MKLARLAWWLLPLAFVVGACGKDYPACYEGDYKACSCADGSNGYAVCIADQNAYSGCVCDGTTPGVKCTPGAGRLFDKCDHGPSDCASCNCGLFQNRGGNLCTKTCASSADCPAPSPGCNPQHQCRSPF